MAGTEYTTEEYLLTLFNKQEHIAYGRDKYGIQTSKKIPKDTQFISINPMRPGTTRADANVSNFRNFLIEIDKAWPFQKQYDYIEGSGLPFASCVASGGKSLHFVVSCSDDCIDEAEWRLKAAALLSCFPKADQSTKNPSRFTRLGGGTRHRAGDQKIIELRGRTTQENLSKWIMLQPGYYKFIEKLNFMAQLMEEQGEPFGTGRMTRTGRAFLEGEILGEGRNKALYITASDLRDNGFTEGEVIEALVPIAVNLGLAQREIYATIKSSFKRKGRGDEPNNH